MALGLAAPLVAAMMKAVPAAAQDASPAAAPSGEPIKIGAPYNLTGGYASIDNPAANGSKLAIKEINAAGGVLGRPLEIFIEDGKSDMPTITSVAKKLVDEDGVNALVGLTDTSYMLAAGPVAQDAGLPFLDVGGTAPLITTVGDYIFMLPFGDNVQAAVSAEFARRRAGRRRRSSSTRRWTTPSSWPSTSRIVSPWRISAARSSPSSPTRWVTRTSRPSSPISRTSILSPISSLCHPTPEKLGRSCDRPAIWV